MRVSSPITVLVSLIVLLRDFVFSQFFTWCSPMSPLIQLNDICTCISKPIVLLWLLKIFVGTYTCESL